MKELVLIDHEKIYNQHFHEISKIKELHEKIDLNTLQKLNELIKESWENGSEDENSSGEEEENNVSFDNYQELPSNKLTSVEVKKIKLTDQNKKIEFQRFPIPKRFNDDEYKEIIITLKERQYKYLHHCLHNIKTNEEPFYEYVAGAGGVGKTRLITALNQSILRYYDSLPGNEFETLKVLITAWTGKV